MANRLGVFLDVENLVHDLRSAGDFTGAGLVLAALVHRASAEGTIVACIAAADRTLAQKLGPILAPWGVRLFIHRGGPDAADLALLERLDRELPVSCDAVMIGSGDGIFASAAETLRAQGKRVIVAGPNGRIASALKRQAHSVIPLNTLESDFAGLLHTQRQSA